VSESRIERKVREWEREALPARPRGRAVFRLLPDPGIVAMAALGVAVVVTGQGWPLLVALVVAGYNLACLYAVDRYGVTCQTADHWVGDGEMPEGMTEICPSCRVIPFRELWRGGRR